MTKEFIRRNFLFLKEDDFILNIAPKLNRNIEYLEVPEMTHSILGDSIKGWYLLINDKEKQHDN